MASRKYKLSAKQFALLDVLASGGFARAWLCWRKDTREIVAVKVPDQKSDADTEV